MPYFAIPKDKVRPTIKAEMDGVQYILQLRWNMRSGWYLDLLDSTGDIIFAGRRMTPDWDLLRRITDERRPPGKLLLIDTTGQGEPPGQDDLGVRHVLMYASEAELEAL